MYLIDGHNLIGRGLIPGIALHQEDDEARLVAWLRARQPNLRQKIVVIFDGGIPGGTSSSLSGGGVTAIFAAQHRTNADKVILTRVRQARPASTITVVTHDGVLRQAVSSLGAQVMRPHDFVQRLQQIPRRWRKTSDSGGKLEPRLTENEIKDWLLLFEKGESDH